MTINYDRLKLAIQAVQESPKPEAFDMDCYVHGAVKGFSIDTDPHCGSPGCVLGHLALRPDLQGFLAYDENAGMIYAGQLRTDIDEYGEEFDAVVPARYDDKELRNWFGISEVQAEALFGPRGCGDAKTVDEAVAYLQEFIDAHQRVKLSLTPELLLLLYTLALAAAAVALY